MDSSKNLTFRRQYILGNEYIKSLKNWDKLQINSELFLTIHPDLEHVQIEIDGIKLTLLGFLIDPYHPQNTNEINLKKVLNKARSFEDVLKNTYDYSGRWAIIYTDERETKMLHDPCGLRQIFYTKKNGKVWCGSQPNLLAEILKLDRDTSTNLLDYIGSDYYENEEGAWYGEGTVYNDVKHLLPNHYFDLDHFKAERYWIDNESNVNLEGAVKVANEILKGSLIAINNRFEKPMLAVTAGWDSRLLLAASKEISSDINYFVSTMNTLSHEHMDIKIPNNLLNKLGLKLDILDNLSPLKEEFKSILKKSVSMARVLPKTLTIQYHYENSGDTININGNVSEIIRITPARARVNPKDIDGHYLAKMYGYPSINYVVSALDKWLLEARQVANNHTVDVMELFYWEQRMGNWGSMYQAEQDIAIEEFCPFNNRKLLMVLLKLDKKDRTSPNYELYQRLISDLWPETLNEPINPLSLKGKIKKSFVGMMPLSVKANLKSFVKSLRNDKNVQG
ncbi:hypothetical protein [Priestia filamentosa]|uniref:hypothetical protein n=1 Tax=Priestia filamentosa TaxID=1402861 RepID=UPI001C1E37AE|nr:hypothetical protein [Priestia filamentosa]